MAKENNYICIYLYAERVLWDAPDFKLESELKGKFSSNFWAWINHAVCSNSLKLHKNLLAFPFHNSNVPIDNSSIYKLCFDDAVFLRCLSGGTSRSMARHSLNKYPLVICLLFSAELKAPVENQTEQGTMLAANHP